MSSATSSPPSPGWAARIAGAKRVLVRKRVAAGDEGEIVGAAAQFVDEIGDQIVKPAILADQADERLTGNGSFRREDGGFDAEHPLAPACGGRQIEKLNVEGLVALSASAARRGAHRP